MKKKKGFTLVELIVVIAITAIFGAIVLSISTTSGKLFSMTQSDSYINDEARLALSVLEEDIRVGKEIYCKDDGYLNGNSSITIDGGNTVKCSDIGLPQGQFKILLKVKVRGELIYYVHYGDKLERMKFDGVIFKTINTISNVEEGIIKKNQSDTNDKRYFVEIKFKGYKGEIQEYKSAVMPRN